MINFSNFRDHPSDQKYKVFHFYSPERADYFEQLIREAGIWYEKADETDEGRPIYYFGVKKLDFQQANRINYLVSAKFRKPFMPNKALRLLVLGITLIAIGLAIAGILVS